MNSEVAEPTLAKELPEIVAAPQRYHPGQKPCPDLRLEAVLLYGRQLCEVRHALQTHQGTRPAISIRQKVRHLQRSRQRSGWLGPQKRTGQGPASWGP